MGSLKDQVCVDHDLEEVRPLGFPDFRVKVDQVIIDEVGHWIDDSSDLEPDQIDKTNYSEVATCDSDPEFENFSRLHILITSLLGVTLEKCLGISTAIEADSWLEIDTSKTLLQEPNSHDSTDASESFLMFDTSQMSKHIDLYLIGRGKLYVPYALNCVVRAQKAPAEVLRRRGGVKLRFGSVPYIVKMRATQGSWFWRGGGMAKLTLPGLNGANMKILTPRRPARVLRNGFYTSALLSAVYLPPLGTWTVQVPWKRLKNGGFTSIEFPADESIQNLIFLQSAQYEDLTPIPVTWRKPWTPLRYSKEASAVEDLVDF